MSMNQLGTDDVAVREVAKARFPEDRERMAEGLERAAKKLKEGEYHTECSECEDLIWTWEAEKDYIGRKICESCESDFNRKTGDSE